MSEPIVKEWPLNATVEAVARIIDPGAFQKWHDGSTADAKPVESSRQKYMRSRAICKAHNIIRELMYEDLHQVLFSDILASWKAQGLPEETARQLAETQSVKEWRPEYSAFASDPA